MHVRSLPHNIYVVTDMFIAGFFWQTFTVNSRYLELPLISNIKSGPCLNKKVFQQVTKYVLWKREETAPKEQFNFSTIFQYISDFKNQITYSFVKCGCSINFFLQFCKSEVRISRSISESLLDFEIHVTRVDCIHNL